VTEEQENMIRKAVRKEIYGEVQKQLLMLAAEIIEAFETPDQWPMTDADRCALLKRLYSKAKTIRDCDIK